MKYSQLDTLIYNKCNEMAGELFSGDGPDHRMHHHVSPSLSLATGHQPGLGLSPATKAYNSLVDAYHSNPELTDKIEAERKSMLAAWTATGAPLTPNVVEEIFGATDPRLINGQRPRFVDSDEALDRLVPFTAEQLANYGVAQPDTPVSIIEPVGEGELMDASEEEYLQSAIDRGLTTTVRRKGGGGEEITMGPETPALDPSGASLARTPSLTDPLSASGSGGDTDGGFR